MASGALTGAGTGVLAAALTGPSGLVLGLVGAVAGGFIGRMVARHISADEWDPLESERPYVGTNSPDDDLE
jgi:outer membrane lipoprotein SlyB